MNADTKPGDPAPPAPRQSLPVAKDYPGWMSHQALCHEMQLRDIFGGSLKITLPEIYRVLRHRQVIGAVAAVVVALFFADPAGFRGMLPDWQIAIIWVIGAAVVLGMKHISFLVIAYLSGRWPGIRIYLPFASLFEFFAAVEVAEFCATTLSGESFTGTLLRHFPKYLVIFVIIEALFVRYIIPPMLADRTPTDNPATKDRSDATPVRVTIAGRAHRLDNLLHIGSEEHYLKVTLRNEIVILRAKITDVTADLPETAGLQPHRSWWIARTAQPRLRREDGKAWLDLSDGTTIPVARARTKPVQDWLDSHADW